MLALWGLYRLGALTPEHLKIALKSPVAEVRKTAALIVEAGAIPGLSQDLAANLDDSDPRAKLAMLRGLAKSAPTVESTLAMPILMSRMAHGAYDSEARTATPGPRDPARSPGRPTN